MVQHEPARSPCFAGMARRVLAAPAEAGLKDRASRPDTLADTGHRTPAGRIATFVVMALAFRHGVGCENGGTVRCTWRACIPRPGGVNHVARTCLQSRQASARGPLYFVSLRDRWISQRKMDVRFEMLGGFRVLVGGRHVARALTVRQQQILAYLVLHARGPGRPRPDRRPAVAGIDRRAGLDESPPRVASPPRGVAGA